MKTAFGDVLRTKPDVNRDVTIMVLHTHAPSVGPRAATMVLVLDADDDSARRHWKIGDRVRIEDEDMERFEPAPPSHVIEDQEMAARLGITEQAATGWRFMQGQADAQKAAPLLTGADWDDAMRFDPGLSGDAYFTRGGRRVGARFDKNGRPLP